MAVWQDDAKSNDSERTIALDTRTVTVLRAHRKHQTAERLAAGPAWSAHEHDRDLVFTRPDGTAIPPKRASQMFTRRVDAAGLPRVGIHGLRHTWATLALRAGVPVKVVSERIGHADPAITMQIYAHALEGDDATAPRSPPQPSSAGDTADGVTRPTTGSYGELTPPPEDRSNSTEKRVSK